MSAQSLFATSMSAQSLFATSIPSALTQVGLSVAATGVVVLLVRFRDFLSFRLAALGRAAYSLGTRKRYVLIWNDFDVAHSRTLIGSLRSQSGRRFHYRALARPEALRSFLLRPRVVAGIVMLDTDVTKLASDPTRADRIESRVSRYVQRGGGLVASHDILWRRVRSYALQSTLGGRLTHFAYYGETPVPYRVQPDGVGHPIAEALPHRFHLSDNEVCFGDWNSDIDVIFATDDSERHPLVVTRTYGEGRTVWLNSGDVDDRGLCRSISAPEEAFVALLGAALQWVLGD